MKKWHLKITILLVALLCFGFTANKLGWLKLWNAEKPTQIINISCPDLSQGCTFKIDQQNYKISSQGPISTSKPVNLTLIGSAKKISLSWQMLAMEMGSNRYKMLSDDQQHWRAETMLPICSQQRLDWLLTLHIDQADVLLQTQSAPSK
jgi:hypothetical protein